MINREIKESPAQPQPKSLGKSPEVDLTSQAWEATNPDEQAEAAGPGEDNMTPEQKRVTPGDVRKHAIAQSNDEPSIPRGRNPDTAMCEDRSHPGRIDKENDC